MAIGTDALIGFGGTQDSGLATASAAVAAGGVFSIALDLSTWTNSDDTLTGFLILLTNYSIAPDDNSSIPCFIRPLNFQGTNDAEIPSAIMQQGRIGTFAVNAVITAQYSWIEFSIPFFKTSGEFEFYIQNNTGQEIPAGWDLFPTSTAPGPHP